MAGKSNDEACKDLTQSDVVGRSGVYPMSGPHPSGQAPVRGQMEWGQGERGRSGYEDHGESELSFQSGVLLGGLGTDWPGNQAFAASSQGATAQRIPVSEWPSFCGWFTRNFSGLETSLERNESGGNQVVEFRNRSLQSMKAYLLTNGVGAIAFAFAVNGHQRLLEITGIKSIELELDAAGWPKNLELESESGKVILRFTGAVRSIPAYTRNSWGE